MSLRRAIVRIGQQALPLRKTTARDMKRLGSYPIPPEAYVWWMNRCQVPGGQIQQTVSPYQQKIMWQFFWNAPQRWYWRLSRWAFPVITPYLIMYLFVYKACEADVEEDIRSKTWY